jgi:metal-dependent amidase/aminoacylase/carboxypeptidase family protein
MFDANSSAFPSFTRIGRIIKEGGSNPFIVPERCIAEISLSCDSVSGVNMLKQILQHCVDGADMAFGTSGLVVEKMRYKNTIPNSVLNEVVAEALGTLGIIFSQGRLAMVSSDIGNVSQITPLGGFRLPIIRQTPPYHTKAFAECCILPEAMKAVQEAVLILSLCGWKVLSNAGVRDRARQGN